jgi:lipid-A-disaccharide synthase
MHIGIVVGEASGDILGADLIRELKQRYPFCRFSGMGGERMLAEGFTTLYPQDRLAVMGLIEPLKRLPELLSIRKHLLHYFIEQRVDIVIGIDSPDFNLTLEKNLRQANIKTIHYVSPSVWAWRQGRIKLIKESVDWMLTLLPFEAAFYEQHAVPVTFVGHPLADQFPLKNDTDAARQRLSTMLQRTISDEKTVIACLPGSRQGEVEKIGSAIWQAMSVLSETHSQLDILIPALNAQRQQQIIAQLEQYPDLPVTIVDGHSQDVMAAADCVVMASGTTTLEAMLLKKPMVVVYKKDALSFWLISRMLKVDHISLPNLLADKAIVPELLQGAATPHSIADAVSHWLDHPNDVIQLQAEFTRLHQQLRRNASATASDVVTQLLSQTT